MGLLSGLLVLSEQQQGEVFDVLLQMLIPKQKDA
jgi:hypothetical protein